MSNRAWLWVVFAGWACGCPSPDGADLASEGRRAAATGSASNAINRENFTDSGGEAPEDPAAGETPIHRLARHGPYVAEQVRLPNAPSLVAMLAYRADAPTPRPVIVTFTPGSMHKIGQAMAAMPARTAEPIEVESPIVEDLFRELVDRGAMIAAIPARDVPWPEGRPRWVWPTPDAAGVEFFITWARVAPWDFGPLIDYLETRPDVWPGRVGYFGFSTTALIGYGLIANEPRITVAVLSGGAGDLKEFAAGWARNFDWASKGTSLWPETAAELDRHNPLLRVERIAPKAILMMNGGEDRIIPVEAARRFHAALRPHYRGREERCQLVVFEDEGHNWSYDGWRLLLLDWFERHLIRP